MEWIEKRKQRHYECAKRMGGKLVETYYNQHLSDIENYVEKLKEYLKETENVPGTEMAMVEQIENIKIMPTLFARRFYEGDVDFLDELYSFYLVRNEGIFAIHDKKVFKQYASEGMKEYRGRFLRLNANRLQKLYGEIQDLEASIRKRVSNYDQLLEVSKKLDE